VAWAHFRDNYKVIEAQYNDNYREKLLETFEREWMDAQVEEEKELAKARDFNLQLAPVTLPDPAAVWRKLSQHLDVETLQQLVLNTKEAIAASMGRAPRTWRARHEVMQLYETKSPEATAVGDYWRLNDIVPLDYHGFLMHARGVIQRQRKSLSFETILKGTMNLRSTDPRDKIYGILGLVSEEARNAIAVDYKKPAPWTLVPTMAYMIRHEPNSLALLGLLWSTRPFDTPVPSWVPDFTISADYRDPRSPIFLRGSCFNASWNDWTQDVAIDRANVVMTASGITVGHVKHIIRLPEQGQMDDYIEIIRSIEPLVKEHCPDNEPIWRTLIGVHNTGPPPPATEPSMQDRFDMLMRNDRRGSTAEASRSPTIAELRFAQTFFDDSIAVIVRGRAFYITDTGFAGVATPDIQEGDLIGHVFGLVRPAVMRAVNADQPFNGQMLPRAAYHRITGFCYVGCRDRADFERQQKDGLADWQRHACYAGQEVAKFEVI
jgi:hypothetical protein